MLPKGNVHYATARYSIGPTVLNMPSRLENGYEREEAQSVEI